MNTTKEYLNAMNQLNEQLKPENQKYFADLREYLSTFKFQKDALTINEQLYQMYLDFLDAQKEGLTAKEYFGNNPKEMADQIINEIPKASFKNLVRYIGGLAVIFWSVRLLLDFSDTHMVIINPILYFFDLILIMCLYLIIFKTIQKSVYRKKALEDMNKIEVIFLLFILLVFILLYFNASNYIPELFVFTVPYPWDIVFVLTFFIGSEILLYRLNILNFSSIVITLILLALIGIERLLIAYTTVQIPFIYKLIIIVSLFVVNFFLKRKKFKKG